ASLPREREAKPVGAAADGSASKGIPVSLSIGGFGIGYSLLTRQAALDLFEHLWNSYFGGSKSGVHRSFGDAWLDGVDLFLEHGTAVDRYNVLALELAKHNIRGGPRKLT
ncbi:Xylanase inhibitor protein 1, partial [Dichanthelium oligosanthes]